MSINYDRVGRSFGTDAFGERLNGGPATPAEIAASAAGYHERLAARVRRSVAADGEVARVAMLAQMGLAEALAPERPSPLDLGSHLFQLTVDASNEVGARLHSVVFPDQ